MKQLPTLIALLCSFTGMAQNHVHDFKKCCKETQIQAGCKNFCNEYLRSLEIEKLFEMQEHGVSPANIDKWGTGGSEHDFSPREHEQPIRETHEFIEHDRGPNN